MKLFSLLAALSLISTPVQAGSDNFNVGFTAGLTYNLGCEVASGNTTKQQASRKMLALMKKQGVPTSYIGRSDVTDLAKSMFIMQKGC